MAKKKTDTAVATVPTAELEVLGALGITNLGDGWTLDDLAVNLGGRSLDLADLHDWDAEPLIVGGITRVEYVEVEGDGGILAAPLVVEMETAAGPVAFFCGAHLEATLRRSFNLPRDDRNSRNALDSNANTVEQRNGAQGHVMVIHQYGLGVAEKPGRNPPRLFRVWSYGSHPDWTRSHFAALDKICRMKLGEAAAASGGEVPDGVF